MDESQKENPASEAPKADGPAKGKKGLPVAVVVVIVVAILGLVGGGYYFWTHKTRTYSEGGVTYKVTGDEKNATIKSEDGTQTNIGDKVKLPSNWPKNVPIYPDSTLTMASAKDGSDFAATMTTKDKTAAIITWYKAEVQKQGWKLFIVPGSEKYNDDNFTFENDTMAGTVVVMGEDSEATRSVTISGSVEGKSLKPTDAEVQQQSEALQNLEQLSPPSE